MKYDTQLSELQKVLPGAKNILVAMPSEPSVDTLAAGLALFLSLVSTGKNTAIVSDGVVRVGHTNLFGAGQIQNKLPSTSGGNLVVSLGGVVSNGTVPALEKLDWYPQDNDLNLVFHVVPGQKFEPTHITHRFEGGAYDLIFVVGASSLSSLGSIYTGHEESFRNIPLANLDNKADNIGFGTTNVVDPQASSLSEILTQVFTPLQLPFEGDIASNLLAGIFAATDNLQGPKTTADTYASVALAMQMGGQRPQAPVQPTPEGVNFSQAFGGQPQQAAVSQPVATETEPQPSPEERPTEEGTETVTPENDWLTPKIFKGSSIG